MADDDPEFPSSEEMIEDARKELSAPLDEEALLRPVEFAHDEADESMRFDPATGASPAQRRPSARAVRTRPTTPPALKARLILGLAIGILVMLGVIVAAVATAGH